jgi:toxin FitB
VIASTFEPLPIDAAVAREWGHLAATATVQNVPLLTHNHSEFQLIDDLVDVRTP